MLIERIKKDSLQALKDRNKEKRSILNIVINMHSQLKSQKNANSDIGDPETIKIIQKQVKELKDILVDYKKANNQKEVSTIESQIKILEDYLPKMLSEDEIKQVIESLPDKSIGSVMKHFKQNYQGRVDMSTVNKLVKS